MKEKTVELFEDIVMFSACYVKALASFVLPLSIVSYLLFADVITTILVFILSVSFLTLSYFFYLRNINESRDVLLSKLEKSGRKELNIDEKAVTHKVFNKDSSCQLRAPKNAKQFTLTLVFLADDYLTIYKNCPKSHIFKIEKKKPPGKKYARKKPINICTQSVEYYYSYIQAANFDGKNVIIELNSGATEEIPAAKPPGKKLVNAIRAKLRIAEKHWNEHARGNFTKS